MMKIQLTNINKIKEATIHLKGLTVIAGTNDTGKSTLGKMLFTVIKSLGETHVNQEEERAQRIMDKLEQLYRCVRPVCFSSLVQKRSSNKNFCLPESCRKSPPLFMEILY